MVWNGSFFGSTVPPAAAASAAAELLVVERAARASSSTGSTRMNSAPSAVVLRYVKRSSGSHVALTLPPTTSGLTAAARNFSARA